MCQFVTNVRFYHQTNVDFFHPIVTTARKDMQVVSESEELLNFVKERTLDKKFKIRKEAISGKNWFKRY